MPPNISSLHIIIIAVALLAGTANHAKKIDSHYVNKHHHHHHHDHSEFLSSTSVHKNIKISHGASRPLSSDDTATLNQLLYSSLSCPDSQLQNTSSFPTGQCQSSSGGSSSQYYCDSSAAYYVSYSDSQCQDISNINQYEYGCQSYDTSYQFECVNADLGPSVPFSFPPENFIVQNICTGLNSCPTSNSGCYNYATPANECFNGTKTLCTEDSKWAGTVQYDNSDCNGNINEASFASTTCNGESVATCAGESLDQSLLPSLGYYLYYQNECGNDITTVGYQIPNFCISGGDVISCNNNELIVNGYSNDVCSGPSSTTRYPIEVCNVRTNNATFFCNGFSL